MFKRYKLTLFTGLIMSKITYALPSFAGQLTADDRNRIGLGAIKDYTASETLALSLGSLGRLCGFSVILCNKYLWFDIYFSDTEASQGLLPSSLWWWWWWVKSVYLFTVYRLIATFTFPVSCISVSFSCGLSKMGGSFRSGECEVLSLNIVSISYYQWLLYIFIRHNSKRMYVCNGQWLKWVDWIPWAELCNCSTLSALLCFNCLYSCHIIMTVTGLFVPKTFRSQDRNKFWTFRSLDVSFLGRFVPWTFRSKDDSFPYLSR